MFDVNDLEIQRDPYPTYARLRSEAPVYRIEGTPMWVLSRHEDIQRVLLDHKTFSSFIGVPVPIMSLVLMDPPDHTRLRSSVNLAFAPRQIARLAPRVEAIAEELVSQLAGGSTEFVSAFSNPFPITVICDMLGVAHENRERLGGWARDAMLASFAASGLGTPEQLARSQSGLEAFLSFIDEVIENHDGQPNVIGILLRMANDGKLKVTEVKYFCVLLLFAGHETTANLIGNAMHLLASQPELSETLQQTPADLPNFVDEIVRLFPPLQRVVRRTEREVEIAGVKIPANSLVMLLLGSANRDEAVWSEPDACQMHRETKGNLGFGAGIHYCLGASLARLEARIALEVLWRRFPNIRLDSDRKSERILGFASGSLGWEKLYLRLEEDI